MYVRVTDACELDVDDHVVITTRSSSERERRELTACDMRSVSHTLSWFVESTHDCLILEILLMTRSRIFPLYH
jgi:hypothetical protein